MNLIAELEAEQIKALGKDIPEFAAGDTVRVGYKVTEDSLICSLVSSLPHGHQRQDQVRREQLPALGGDSRGTVGSRPASEPDGVAVGRRRRGRIVRTS